MSRQTAARLREQARENPMQFLGKSYRQIAEEYDVNRDTVGDIFRECGCQFGLRKPGARDGGKQAKAVDDAIRSGKLERDDEYFDVIIRNKGFGIGLTGDYWKRYRVILAWKIKHGERVDPPNWSKIFGFKTT